MQVDVRMLRRLCGLIEDMAAFDHSRNLRAAIEEIEVTRLTSPAPAEQGEPVAWLYEAWGYWLLPEDSHPKWMPKTALKKPDANRSDVRNIRPLYEFGPSTRNDEAGFVPPSPISTPYDE